MSKQTLKSNEFDFPRLLTAVKITMMLWVVIAIITGVFVALVDAPAPSVKEHAMDIQQLHKELQELKREHGIVVLQANQNTTELRKLRRHISDLRKEAGLMPKWITPEDNCINVDAEKVGLEHLGDGQVSVVGNHNQWTYSPPYAELKNGKLKHCFEKPGMYRLSLLGADGTWAQYGDLCEQNDEFCGDAGDAYHIEVALRDGKVVSNK